MPPHLGDLSCFQDLETFGWNRDVMTLLEAFAAHHRPLLSLSVRNVETDTCNAFHTSRCGLPCMMMYFGSTEKIAFHRISA